MRYMPGHRESIDPRTGAIRPGMAAEELAYFTGHGYAVAVAEMRAAAPRSVSAPSIAVRRSARTDATWSTGSRDNRGPPERWG